MHRPHCIKGKQCQKLLDGTKMEKISIEQQGKILGGYDAEGCKKLQRWANEYAEMMEPQMLSGMNGAICMRNIANSI